MMVLLIELYLFIPLSVTLTIFQGHSSVKQLYVLIQLSWNFVTALTLKYGEGHWKWYEQIKLNEQYHHAKFDIYYFYGVS